MANLEGDDLILCQITSQKVRDRDAILIMDLDFEKGGLKQPSNERPNRLFTADYRIILYKIGHLKTREIEAATNKIIDILQR